MWLTALPFLAGSVFLGLVALVCYWVDSSDGTDFVGFMAVLVSATVLVLGAIVVGAFTFQGSSCDAWSRATGRETRHVQFNAFEWQCMVKLDDGSWLERERLRDVGGER